MGVLWFTSLAFLLQECEQECTLEVAQRIRRPEDEVGAQERVPAELQEPVERQQVQLQTQVTWDARAHVQVLRGTAGPCIVALYLTPVGFGIWEGYRKGLSQSGQMCAAARCVWGP